MVQLYKAVRGIAIVSILALLLFSRDQTAVDAADPKAKHIRTETGSFDGVLTASEDTVQKALDKLDDIEIVGAGDNVSIDGVAVVDPDFVSTGDIDFVDTANTITANLNADSVDAGHVNFNYAGSASEGGAATTAVNIADNTGTTTTVLHGHAAGSPSFGPIVSGDITDGTIVYADIQNVSGTDKILGRSSAGAGVIEEIACTSAARDLLDDADAAAQRTTLDVDAAGTDNSTDVTLAVDAEVLLGLSTQELNLDSQDANVVFAGPTSGEAADPTFRALVDDDVPDDITITESDPNVDEHSEIIAIIDNTATDIGTGVWTFAGVTLSANELITLGSQTIKHDGTDFIFDNDIHISATGPNLSLIPTSGDTFGYHVEPDMSQAWLSNETDAVHYLFFDTDHTMRYGRTGNVPAHIFTTDGTGNGEIVLPDDSIGPDEMASGVYDLGTSLEADTLTEGGNAVYNSTEIEAAVEAVVDHDDLQNIDAGEHISWEDDGAGTIHISNYVENVIDTLTATLGAGADGNAVTQTNLGVLQGIDAQLYLDMTGNGVIDLTSDGTLELHSADWDISTTGAITNAEIDADNNTVSNIVIGAECTGASTALTDTGDIFYDAELTAANLETALADDAIDFGTGVVTAAGFTIANDENITFGSETIDFETATSDFNFTDDINISDTDPHIQLKPASGDAFELYAYGSELYCTNVTESAILWRVRADNLFQMYDKYSFVDAAPTDNYILKYDAALGYLNWEEDVGIGVGSPADATYITQTADDDLSAEQNLDALAAGILYSDGSGVISKATADRIETDLTDSAMDFGTGAVSAAEFNLADNEYIEWGTDENITFDGTTSNDFEFSNDININDTHPHLKLVPAAGDAFEMYAFGSELYCTNVDDSAVLWRVKADNKLYFEQDTYFEQDIYAESGNIFSSIGAISFGDEDLTTTGIVDASAHNISDKKVTVTAFTSTGINAAIDALGSEGGEVYLPEGTFTINSKITIDYNNTTLRGSGWGTKLDASAWSTDHVIDLNGCDYVTIRDLQVEGKDGGGNAKFLIYDGNSATTYFTLDHLYLHHSDDMGVKIEHTDSDYGRIQDCLISDCDSSGVYIVRGSNLTIVNNEFFTNGGTGITATAGDDSVFSGNVASSNTAMGLYVSGLRATISNNVATGNGYEGITIGANDYITVVGNVAYNNTRDGIKIDGTDWCLCSGNYSSGNGDGYNDFKFENVDYASITGNATTGINKAERGFYLDNCTYCVLSGNASDSHDTCGIELDGTSDNNHIIYNNLEGETTKITDGGANNTLINSIADAINYGSASLTTTGTINNAADDSKHTWGVDGATDSYIQFGGTNLEYYSSGIHDFGASDLTTTGTGTFGDIEVDSTTLSVDADNHRVGIGTITPSQELDLIGDLELEPTISNNTGVIYKGTDSFIHDFDPPDNSTVNPEGHNTFIGINAGNFTMGDTADAVWESSYNTAVGYEVLSSNTTGYENTAVGGGALASNTTGYENVIIGYDAGEDITTGSGNICIGYMAGEGNLTTASDKLYIDNSDTATPLIYGDFSTDDLTINGILTTAIETVATLGVGATTFVVDRNIAIVTGDAGENTVATITGGVAGQTLVLLFTDAKVTITDTDAHAANSVDLSAAFTSADDTTLTLIFDGTSWYETSRSVN